MTVDDGTRKVMTGLRRRHLSNAPPADATDAGSTRDRARDEGPRDAGATAAGAGGRAGVPMGAGRDRGDDRDWEGEAEWGDGDGREARRDPRDDERHDDEGRREDDGRHGDDGRRDGDDVGGDRGRGRDVVEDHADVARPVRVEPRVVEGSTGGARARGTTASGDVRVSPGMNRRDGDEGPGDGGDGAPPGGGSTSSVRGVVQFRGKPVAVGLQWRLAGDVTEARQTAREEAERNGSDLWCLKVEGEPQIGMGAQDQGHRPGMPALGAELASNLPAEWAGLFAIDGTFYVLSARSGAIERDSDIAFVERADAVELFRDLCGRNVSKFYVSTGLDQRGLGVAGVEEIDVEEVVERFTLRLESLDQTGAMIKRYGPWAGAAIAAVVLAVAFPSQFLALRRLIGIGPSDRTAKVVVAPMPWTGQPKAAASIDGCLKAFAVIPIDAGGWQGKSAKCDGRTMVLVVKREGSVTGKGAPVGWLQDWVAAQVETRDGEGVVLGRPTLGKLSAGGAEVVWKLARSMPRWREADKPSGRIEDERTRLWVAAERNFESSTFSEGAKNAYARTGKMKVVTDLSAAAGYVKLLAGNTTTVPSMTLDLAKFAVTMEVRFHEFIGIPVDDATKRYVRSPDPKTVETGAVPKPEA